MSRVLIVEDNQDLAWDSARQAARDPEADPGGGTRDQHDLSPQAHAVSIAAWVARGPAAGRCRLSCMST